MTSIVGASDVGKSAIIRALGWVLTNKPSGDAFIREGSKEVSAILDIDDKKILRARGKQNHYRMDKQ